MSLSLSSLFPVSSLLSLHFCLSSFLSLFIFVSLHLCLFSLIFFLVFSSLFSLVFSFIVSLVFSLVFSPVVSFIVSLIVSSLLFASVWRVPCCAVLLCVGGRRRRGACVCVCFGVVWGVRCVWWCTLKTLLCVDSSRLRVYSQHVHMCLNMRTCCRYTRKRFECTHGGVRSRGGGRRKRDKKQTTRFSRASEVR